MRAWRGCFLLGLVYAALHPASAHAACRADESADATRSDVYVLLIGWPGVPVNPPPDTELEPLRAIPGDLIAMEAFFSTLRPRCIFVHGPRPNRRSKHHNARFDMLSPDWLAVRDSIDVITHELADRPDRPAKVYVYYGGHGVMRTAPNGRAYTSLFLDPVDPTSGEPGADGEITTQMLHEGVLDPLERVQVTLIVDACQSFFVLETRGGREGRTRKARVRRRRRDPWVFKPDQRAPLVAAIRHRYRHLVALTATSGNELAYEARDYGALFSYAVRSAGLGQADFDADRAVDVTELERLVPFILSTAGITRPRVMYPVAPDGLGSANVFMDFNEAIDVARLDVDVDGPRRFEVWLEPNIPYAVLHPGAGETFTAWLPKGRDFVIVERFSGGPRAGKTMEWRFNTHAPHAVLRLSEVTRSPSEATSRGVLVGRGRAPMLEPRDLATGAALDEALMTLEAESFLLLGANIRADAYLTRRPDGLPFVVGPELRLTLAASGRHWVSVDARYGMGRGRRPHRAGGANRYVYQRLAGAVAYRHLASTGRDTEWTIGGSVGGGVLHQESTPSSALLSLLCADLSFDLRWMPFEDDTALHVAMHGGLEALGADRRLGARAGLSIGWEWAQ